MLNAAVADATAPGNNVVVHAAAGTGKTWLLTSRIVRLLLEGSEPGAILAITFTRKAAGEIQERVTERLLSLAGSDEATLVQQLADIGVETSPAIQQTARGLYEKHLAAVHSLRTTTFHAFCQEILRRFPLEADVPPGFELMESTVELEDAAWSKLDAKASGETESPLSRSLDGLLKEFGVAGTRAALNDFLAHRGDWWAYTEEETQPLICACQRLRELLNIKIEEDPSARFIENPRTRQQMARCAELLARHPTAKNRDSAARLARLLADAVPPDRAFEYARGVFLTEADEIRELKLTQVLEKKLGPRQAAELIELHQQLASLLQAAITEQKRHWTYRVSSDWYACGMALLEEYQRLKMERGLLDFTDLEWKTYRLLNRSRHAEWVQYKLDQRIDHLLVDEFQDTNPTQWRLLLPLLQEMVAGDPERRRSVFLVGDEKQSIYRFRRADPRLFHTARHWLQQYAGARTLAQHLSWRSSPAVIGFVNLVFHRHPDDGIDPESDYPLQDFAPHATHLQHLWGRAELLPLIRRQEPARIDARAPWRNPLEQARVTAEDERHRQEGELIAARIRTLLGAPIGHGRSARPLTADDVIILLRDRAHARSYEEALRRAGIAYTGTGRGAFRQALEVRDMRCLLRHLLEPYNDLALASALRSPVFGATEAELLCLAQNPPGSWHQRLMRLEASPTPGQALASARQLLPRWSRYAMRLPVHDLLDRIYHEGNVIERYFSAAPPQLRARIEANLSQLLDLALDMDGGRYPSLARFLARLDSGLDDDGLDTHPGTREPRVRVMTIHAAKGLEAPVVFLADAARPVGHRDRGIRSLIDWPVNDARPRHFHLAGTRKKIDDASQALQKAQQWQTRREEANLLYVALTRARQVLYVSGCEPGQGDRGWYGFIEKRLTRADASSVPQGVKFEVSTLPCDPARTVFNTRASLEFGAPPASLPPAMPAADPGFTIDPALTRPVSSMAAGVLNPSQLPRQIDPDPAPDMEPSAAGRPGQRRGVIIHRMLEQLTGGEARAAVALKLRGQLDGWLEEDLFGRCWTEACAVVDDPRLSEFFDPTGYQEARNETPILYQLGDRDVYGVMDRLIVREEEIVLIDYKTHAGATPENISTLALEYAGQMQAYGEGVRRLWPRKRLRMLLLFTACRGVVELRPGQATDA